MVPLIYIASSLGFSEAGRYFYYNQLVPRVNLRFEIIDPWKLTDQKITDEALRAPEGSAQRTLWAKACHEIGMNNREGIKRSHLLLAVLDGSDVDSGTASEIGFAAGIGKPIEGYRSDFRLAADNVGCLVNIQVQYFVQLQGGIISSNLDDLDEVLRARVREFNRV